MSEAPGSLSRAAAGTIAAGAFLAPLALSASSSPSPNHPRIMAWYLALREPPFKPPDWAFPVAWTAIEAALATAAYRLLRTGASTARNKALALLGWNVFMIGGWSRLFFRQHALGVSTLAAASLAVSGAAFVREARKVDVPASRAGIPFVAWVTFATVLTGSIWYLNGKARRRLT